MTKFVEEACEGAFTHKYSSGSVYGLGRLQPEL